MLHKVIVALVLLGITGPANSQISKLYPHPDLSDAESWNFYCGGIFKEIQRQAVEENNQLQFNEAEKRRNNLFQETLHFFRTKEWEGKESDLSWMGAGEKIAGRDTWDTYQLENGDNQLRVTIRLLRQKDLQFCDNMAEEAIAFTQPHS